MWRTSAQCVAFEKRRKNMKNEKKVKRGILAICIVVATFLVAAACLYIFSGSVELAGEGLLILTLALGVLMMGGGFFINYAYMFYLGIGVILTMSGCLIIRDGWVFYGEVISVGGIALSFITCLKEICN